MTYVYGKYDDISVFILQLGNIQSLFPWIKEESLTLNLLVPEEGRRSEWKTE